MYRGFDNMGYVVFWKAMVLVLLLLLGINVVVANDRAFVENTDMNPCEDFYTYTCESQCKSPDGSISDFKSLVAKAQDNVIAKLKGILEDEEDDASGENPIAIARKFYATCMDTGRIDAEGIKPIRSVLKEQKGWPLTMKQYDQDVDWQDLHTFYCKLNVCPLYEITVNSDALRRTHTIMLRQPRTVVREPLLYKSKTFYKYVDYIKTIAMIVANASESKITEDEAVAGAKQIASFEAELSKILESNERLEFYRPTVLHNFQNITNLLSKNEKNSTVNWMKVINGMYPVRLVEADDTIDISTLSYFPRLMQLLQRTPSRVIVNYIHWRFVHQYLPHTSSELRDLYFDMKGYMNDPAKSLPRWRFCGFDSALDHALSYTFAKRYITPKLEKYVQRVLNDIKQVTIRTIKRSFLLNEDEKSMAEQKVLSMNFVLGIPEPLQNLSVLNSYYKQLTISVNHFKNALNLRRFYKTKEFDVIKGDDFNLIENDKFMRITTLSSIGSLYDFFENRVLIKIENLVSPLFDPDYPEFKKYGILGFTLAYEIMHAFNDADSIGSGKPRRHLYSEETKLKYWNKMECFINQFDNYHIPDPLHPGRHIYVDGERSVLGNMADSAAIHIAFQAYRDRSRKQGVSSIEDDEDFFVSFANLLCRPELEEFYLNRFNLALRTLPRFRVIGSLSNTNEFAQAFACSSGARMNPNTKCNFWN